MVTVPPDPMPLLVSSAVDEATVLAADAVRDYCGWHIAPVITQTIRPRITNGRDLILPTLLLLDVTAATSDGTAVTITEWDDAGIVRAPSGYPWSTALRGVEVTFSHGYDVCPPALEGAIKSMAARGVTSIGVSRTQVGQVSRQYLAGASEGALAPTPGELAIIRRYRIPQVS